MKLLTIELNDELTGDTALMFADGLSRLNLDDHDGVLLQFTTKSQIDVNGLAVVVRVYSHLKGRKKRLYVDGAAERVTRAMDRLGLARVLHVPNLANRLAVDTDPSLSVLTGQFPVVPDALEKDPSDPKKDPVEVNTSALGPSTQVSRSHTSATEKP